MDEINGASVRPVPVVARPVGLSPGEEHLVNLEAGDLTWSSQHRNWGQLHRAWITSPVAHFLNGSAWRVFCLIVADASPSKACPWRVVAWTDTALARALPDMARGTATKARHDLVKYGFVRCHKLRTSGYLWILQEPDLSPNGSGGAY
jgi:hypothetical protein